MCTYFFFRSSLVKSLEKSFQLQNRASYTHVTQNAKSHFEVSKAFTIEKNPSERAFKRKSSETITTEMKKECVVIVCRAFHYHTDEKEEEKKSHTNRMQLYLNMTVNGFGVLYCISRASDARKNRMPMYGNYTNLSTFWCSKINCGSATCLFVQASKRRSISHKIHTQTYSSYCIPSTCTVDWFC